MISSNDKIYVTIGKATFIENIPSQLLISLHSIQVQPTNIFAYILQKQDWSITKGEWSEWELLFMYLKSCECVMLDLQNNRCDQILKIISVPVYSCLTFLGLDNNSIQSIEPLAFLKAPILQALVLKKNNLTQAKPFNKLNFPQLTMLVVSQNHFSTFDSHRMTLKAQYDFGVVPAFIKSDYFHDLCLMAKFQISKVKSFRNNGHLKSKIWQIKVQQILKKKIKCITSW